MHLSSLYRFPLKSAAGEALQQCASDALGLVGDRRWMVVAGGAAVIAGSILLSLLIFGWDMHVLWYETTIAPYASSTVSA